MTELDGSNVISFPTNSDGNGRSILQYKLFNATVENSPELLMSFAASTGICSYTHTGLPNGIPVIYHIIAYTTSDEGVSLKGSPRVVQGIPYSKPILKSIYQTSDTTIRAIINQNGRPLAEWMAYCDASTPAQTDQAMLTAIVSSTANGFAPFINDIVIDISYTGRISSSIEHFLILVSNITGMFAFGAQ